MNYTEIVDTALSYADRNDSEVTTRMDLFLRQVEARINRKLKVRQQSARAYVYTVANKEYYGLPTDFAGLRDIEIRATEDGAPRTTMRFLAPDAMNLYITEGGHIPSYTVIGNQVQIWPRHDGMIMEIIYYQKVPPLTAQLENNWVSDIAPDLYIQGLLVEINSFCKDAEAGLLWENRFQATLNEIDLDDNRSRWSGSAPVIRVA